MDTFFQDLRYGLRLSIREPAFTVIVLLTLALGIGANTAIFSVVNRVMLRPLPYSEPDRLVMVWGNSPERDRDTVTPANFLDWREQNQVFDEMAGFTTVSFNLVGDAEPERIMGASVSTNFFSLLGVEAALGRTFDQSSDWQVVVLGHGLWQSRFGSDPTVIGKTIRLNDRGYTVIGVMPREFTWPRISPSPSPASETVALWVPAVIKDIPQLGTRVDQDLSASRNMSFMRVLARLKPGVEMAQAQAEMSTIAARLAHEYPDTNTGRGASLVRLDRQIVGNAAPALIVLLAAVAFVLLIACANVANLFLVRASARRKEIAIRAALGAGRRRIIRQLLTESLLLALAAGLLGLGLAAWGVPVLVSLGPGDIPGLGEVAVDRAVLGFTLLISLLTGIAFGLLPALRASRPDLNESLKEGARSSTEGPRRSRSLLIVTEVALAMVLLIGSGLLLKSLVQLSQVKPGFDPSNLLTMSLSLPTSKYPERRDQSAVFEQVLARVSAIGGVESAGAVLNLPFGGDDITFPFYIEGRPEPAPGEEYKVGYQVASPGYFATLRVPILLGRDFAPADNDRAPQVAIINETAARRYLPGEDPVGKRIRLGGNRTWLTVVGVVADVRHRGLDSGPRAEAYVSYLQSLFPFMDFVVRAEGSPEALLPAIRSAVWDVDRNQPIARISTMEALLRDSIARPRFTSLLVAVFSGVALLLAAIGIYGVMSYSVTERTKEIGIRMALGAGHRDVIKLVVRQGMSLALVGVGIGLGAALALTRLMSSLLYEVSATDPATFALLSLLLAGVASLASYIPARRAARVDPMVALRDE